MPINIDILKPIEEYKDNVIYNDINLRMSVGKLSKNSLNEKSTNKDLETSVNFESIKNSIINLFTTSPGQKILEPEFGLNFGDLLFLPVSKKRAKIIGDIILKGVRRYEPRVNIFELDIVSVPEQSTYEIEINLTIPEFSNNPLNLKGALSKSGFYTF